MSDERTDPRLGVPQWVVLLISVAALVIATASLTATLVSRPSFQASGGGMMGGSGFGGGMMGGYGSGPGAGAANGPQPGDPGFIAGTVASPRVVRVLAGPGFTFSPSTIAVARGETVTFEVTTMGPTAHEFMVGPAEAVAADEGGTPEIANIGMMATKSLTVAFDESGPYAFACHFEGHYEAGMRGIITLAG
jgi:uncharacterized cupredoxin-like copper-binding protein